MGTFFVWKRYFEADLIKKIPLLKGHTKESGILVTCAIGIPLIICCICLERGTWRQSKVQLWLLCSELTRRYSSLGNSGPTI